MPLPATPLNAPSWGKALGYLRTITASFKRSHAARGHPAPTFPVIEKCPSPTCQCAPMPSGLDIDYKRPLSNTVAAYQEQVLISTGRDDWASRAEEEEDAVLLRGLKSLLGRGGTFSNPFHNIMLTNSSFAPSVSNSASSVYLFPSFRYIPSVSLTDGSMKAFTQAFLLPEKLHPAHEIMSSEDQRQNLMRKPALQDQFPGARAVDELVVLICGHGGRDERCGILGPILRSEFEEKLEVAGFDVVEEATVPKGLEKPSQSGKPRARVGLISHIGGHKYAGNVIIYIPPTLRQGLSTSNPMDGKGIWYGRVEPGHVEGIVNETVLNGSVIAELFRGGVGKGGEALRL
ncbi:hypothetical protein L228DRAFT_249231 [Xylona heveae TC161]|uniref:Altered inheritance of mitochondria protein 32 n=1 Tax=Xylona heveae (strain CBS 132557 / TC161) TaxID=1328760 RepID=A0A165FV72_XYLHT|nr:hypothetical protein L228DRAFT_249231 [Xylona heveae TC161]KZF21418.1 hypothetical protein L228DRAFT_249231 [Xylona heveae TC161]